MSKNNNHWSKETEEAVLGAILYDEKVLPEVISILEPEDFYSTQHRLIYRQMIDLCKDGEKVDTLILHEALKETGKLEKAGGGYFLTGLFESCPTAANAPDYARKVFKLAQRRKLLNLGYKLYEGDPEEKDRALTALQEFNLVPPWERSRDAFELHTFEALLSDQTPAPIQLMNRGLLPAQSILLLSGAPKTGKSILALNFGLCLAAGQDWFQFEIEGAIKVLIIQSEVVRWALKNRLEKMKTGCEFPIPEESIFISDPFRCNIRRDEDFRSITETISRIQPNVVIFDPLVAFHNEDENSNDAMERVMLQFRELTFLGVSVILVHHSRKLNEDSVVAGPRGASAIAGAADSIMELTKKEGVITAKFDLRYDEAPEAMTFKRNPESLWLERYNPEVEIAHNNYIMKKLQGTGSEGIPLINLVKALSKKFEKSENTARFWIKQLSNLPGHIITIEGKGNSKKVYLTCNLN